VRLAARLGPDARGVAAGLLEGLRGIAPAALADLAGLLLGQAEHRAGPAPETGVRRTRVLGDLVLRRAVLLIELRDLLLGPGQGRGDPGLLPEDLAQVGVDGGLVVA